MSVRPLRILPTEGVTPPEPMRRHPREPERRAAAAQLDLRSRPLLVPLLEQLAHRVGAHQALVVAVPRSEPVVLATFGTPFPDSLPGAAWLACSVVADAEPKRIADLRAEPREVDHEPEGAVVVPLCTRDRLPVGALVVTAPAPWHATLDALPHVQAIARLLEAHLETQQLEGTVRANHENVMHRVDALLAHHREVAERHTELNFLVRELVHAQYFGVEALERAREGHADALDDLEAVRDATFGRAERVLALLAEVPLRGRSLHAPLGIPALLRWVQQSLHDTSSVAGPVHVQARLSRSPRGDGALLHHGLTLLCQAAVAQAPPGAPVILVARDIAHGWALEVMWPGPQADALDPRLRQVLDDIAEAHEGFFVRSPEGASPRYQLCLPYA